MTTPTPGAVRLRALRGATTVAADNADEIRGAVAELLRALMDSNAIAPDDILSAIFSATPDLRSHYPAAAARETVGWSDVAMLCLAELPVDGALPRCIRVIIHVGLPEQNAPKHVYLRGARHLRPDWADAQ